MAYALFSDNFNRADVNPLNGNWVGGYTSQNLRIVGNEVRSDNDNVNDSVMAFTLAPGADHWAKVTIATIAGAAFVRTAVECRFAAPTTFSAYDGSAYRNATNSTEIDEVTAGSFAALAVDNTATWAATDTLVLACMGSTILLYRNGGVPLIATTDATLTNQRFGLLCFGTTAANMEVDNWTGGTLPITFVSAGTEGDAASGNITPGLPASIQPNDILICCCHSNDQVSHSMTSDWTQIVNSDGTGQTISHLSVWWHRYNGVNPSAVITHSAGNGIIGGICAFRGCKTGGSPLNATGTINGGIDATIEHNGITLTQDACMILAINGASDDNNRTLLSGWTNIFEDTGAGTNNAFVGTSDAVSTRDESVSAFYIPGFIGSTGTVTVTQAAADPWSSILIALEPEDNLMGAACLAEL